MGSGLLKYANSTLLSSLSLMAQTIFVLDAIFEAALWSSLIMQDPAFKTSFLYISGFRSLVYAFLASSIWLCLAPSPRLLFAKDSRIVLMSAWQWPEPPFSWFWIYEGKVVSNKWWTVPSFGGVAIVWRGPGRNGNPGSYPSACDEC